MQTSTSTRPSHTHRLAGPWRSVREVRVLADRVEVDERRPPGRRRRRTIDLVPGLGAVVGEDWRLVGRGALARTLLPTTHSVDYGGRVVVSGVRSRERAEQLARAIDAVSCRGRAELTARGGGERSR
ncbi:MAG: hypothetical protein AAFZ07_24625 [Actinomycetota bacterium]